MYNWKTSEILWRRIANEKFNNEWISSMGLDKAPHLINDSSLSKNYDYFSLGYHSYQVIWLKNIDLIMSMLPFNVDVSKYNLFDLGSGAGISTIYIASYYDFKDFIALELNKILCSVAKKNLKSLHLDKKILNLNGNILDTDFQEYDKSVFFYYNSMACDKFEIFLKKNIDYFRKTGCILLYNYDECYENCKKYYDGSLVIRNELYNMTVVLFK